ncbi:MAG TPA: OmcA/MtrC family decaheme c-type cytochrome [Bryobacteraceae bacterium]|jgi:OmcA/MtrC family decaheme c-type cytochrome|nr:OmcA/MtrC family decaheme c-type cytochrome [Bryobacteraceae bacterium]
MSRFSRYFKASAIAAAAVMSLSSAPRKPYSRHEKAFFADAATVDFVRPGLTITVNSASIASDGTITVSYMLADPNGLPLDNSGVQTPGTISTSFVAGVLPQNTGDYSTYTTSSATGAALGSIVQPGADSGGTISVLGSGQYQYVFHTKAPSGYDATATHTIGIYGSRNLTVYSLGTNYASTTYNFVPNGSKVTHINDVVKTASCNTCHDQLSAHGGSRRGLDLCVICHNPQNLDPNDGKSFDAKVFFHKLHMGASLPSVVAGGTYSVTNRFGTTDFSKVVFPADPGDPRRCETCHSQTSGAAQATAYLTNPTRAACGSCHDDVNFATGVNHPGGPQFDDNLCATCHIPQGEMDFDASIKGAHVAPIASSLLGGLAVAITKVSNGTAGTAPVVAFTVKDGSGNPLPLSKLGSISFTMAGPTTDYGYTTFGSATTPGYVTESATKATCDASGNCLYTFTNIVPAKATGTYAIGVEARRTDVVLAGTTSQQSIQYGAPNKVVYFSVDGSPVAPRRSVVAIANCNGCHVSLQVHGALRNNTEYCVMCHNPSNTDVSVRGSAVVAADKTAPPQGINFNLLVHRIHDGVNMAASKRTYVVVGFGGSHNDFSGTLFPAMSPTGAATDLANCSMCHVNSSELNLPIGLNPVTDPQGPINPVQPVASACSGCHVDLPSASHFLSNTTTLGEACTVCHSSGAAFAVDKVHAQY